MLSRIKLGSVIGSIMTACAAFPSVVHADFKGQTDFAGAGGMAAFTGSARFSPIGNSQPTGNNSDEFLVDFAVFAPGQFTQEFKPLDGYQSPAATDYVYAYQIYNSSPKFDMNATGQLKLSASMTLVSALGWDAAYDHAPLSNTKELSNSRNIISFNYWYQSSDDGRSITLMLASAFAPQFGKASLLDFGNTKSGRLPVPVAPTPVPTPGAGLLAALGLAGLGMVRRQLA